METATPSEWCFPRQGRSQAQKLQEPLPSSPSSDSASRPASASSSSRFLYGSWPAPRFSASTGYEARRGLWRLRVTHSVATLRSVLGNGIVTAISCSASSSKCLFCSAIFSTIVVSFSGSNFSFLLFSDCSFISRIFCAFPFLYGISGHCLAEYLKIESLVLVILLARLQVHRFGDVFDAFVEKRGEIVNYRDFLSHCPPD